MGAKSGMKLRSSAVLALLLALAAAGCGGRAGSDALAGKQILGSVETIRIDEAELDFAGRIDTGAEASAIHALDLELDGVGEGVVGSRIGFTLENERGQRRRLSGVVADVVQVRTAGGSEIRVRVPLQLSFRGVHKSVLVSLSDRSAMSHKLLVGRDWLGDDFLVDVTRDSSP